MGTCYEDQKFWIIQFRDFYTYEIQVKNLKQNEIAFS